jgi:phosphoglycerate dehydrogenase-like enzyme
MPRLLVLSKHADEYRVLVEEAGLPELELVAAANPSEAVSIGADCEIVFGEPTLISEALPALINLRWTQATWAGVEPLLDPSLRRDYTLTNARGVFGGLMSEYVFGYLLFHERRILERIRAQEERRWNGSVTGTLRGKTIGLLGVGSIGAHLAATAKHFGMTRPRIYACQRRLSRCRCLLSRR